MESASAPIEVDIVSDVVCPWCVVGYRQLATAAAQLDVELAVRWHPFQLNPRMADEGEDIAAHLARKYGSTPASSREVRQRLSAFGAEVGFTFNHRDDMRIYPTRRAHQLLHWAGPSGKTHALKQALFAAYFTEGRNVNDPEVLVGCAEAVGLDPHEARAALEDARFAEAVNEAAAFWTSRGVSGVPAMLFDRRHLMVGARGIDGYHQVLKFIVDHRSAASAS